MDLFEMGEERQVRREEAAEQLRALADQLARNNSLTRDHDGRRVTVKVPDVVQLKIDLEVEDDETELEIEISW